MAFNLKYLIYIFIFSFFFHSSLLSYPVTPLSAEELRDRFVSYVDKSGYITIGAEILPYGVSNKNSLFNEIYLENIYVDTVESSDKKSVASFVFHASKDVDETILGVGMYINASPFENLEPNLYQAESFSGLIYNTSTDRRGSNIFILRFPLRKSVPLSKTNPIPVEYNVNIKQLAYFVDIQRPDKRVERLWVNNNGRDFTHNEIFSEMIPLDKYLINTETKAEKITFRIKTDKPIFNAARHYYCSSFFEQ